MARYVSKYTAETRKRWLKDGRGRGVGATYKGWLTVFDVPSKASTKHRLVEGRHMRTCHLLSNLEERGFLYYDFCGATRALYDQYRLDLEETLEIAESLNIKHPRVPNTGEWWDMTTDLVIIAEIGGKEVVLPRSCKMSHDLSNWNNAEHAEIERVYWQRKGAKLQFITEEETCIPEVLARNLQALKPWRLIDRENDQTYDNNFIAEMLARMRFALGKQVTDCSLNEFCAAFETRQGLKSGQGLHLALHFIYRHELGADLLKGDICQQSIFEIRSKTRLAKTLFRVGNSA